MQVQEQIFRGTIPSGVSARLRAVAASREQILPRMEDVANGVSGLRRDLSQVDLRLCCVRVPDDIYGLDVNK